MKKRKAFANMTEAVQYALKIAERKKKEWKKKTQKAKKVSSPNTP